MHAGEKLVAGEDIEKAVALLELIDVRRAVRVIRANAPEFAWALAFFLAAGIVLSLVVIVLTVTIIGLILTPFLGFYFQVVIGRVFALAYRGPIAAEVKEPVAV